MSHRRTAALVVFALLLSGCAARSAGVNGRSQPDTHASSHPPPMAVNGAVTGDCARITSLTDLIHTSGGHYTWSLGTLRPAGKTEVASTALDNRPEVFTGFVLSAATALYGPAPSRPVTVWAAGGTKGGDTTTTDDTLDFATSPSGTALVSLFPSSSLPGQFEFEALPATKASVVMITVGCWSAGTPIGDRSQLKRLTARSSRGLTTPAKASIVRYHNGRAAGPQSVSARFLPIAAIRTLLR